MNINTSKSKTDNWINWAIAALPFCFVLAASIVLYFVRYQANADMVETGDLIVGAGIGLVISGVLAVAAFFRALHGYSPFMLMIGEWVLAGVYVYISDAEPMLLVGIAGYLATSGMLALGTMWGTLHIVMTVAITMGTAAYIASLDEAIQFSTDYFVDVYGPAFLNMLFVILGSLVWFQIQGGRQFIQDSKVRRASLATENTLVEMRENIRAISQMTNTLSATLNFEKILKATMDIGDFSMRQDAGQRMVSMVLLFGASEETLYIAHGRGLHKQATRNVSATQGVIGRTLDECIPIIGQEASKDPVLRGIGGFEGVRSVLCIPLRVNYDNYGVLVYGSDRADAFREETIDTLNAIAIQATVAMQNAVLYTDLRDEKERIIEMEEDARKSLVRDLHDVPTQTISAVAMRIRIIMRLLETSPDEVPGELEMVEDMALRATEEIRHVLFKLRPLALETQGLTAALDQLAEKMETTYGQPCTVRIHPEVETYLDKAQQGALFYLIEEAVNNARKYAEASMITVQAARHNDAIAVRITDNGVGFDSVQVNAGYDERGSFGMVNMRERAQLLDGSLTLKTEPGRGTTITVIIPIDENRQQSGGPGQRRTSLQNTKLAANAQSRLWER